VTTPEPRPFVDETGAEKTSEPRDAGDDEPDDRTRQLIDLAAGGTGSPPAASGDGGSDSLAQTFARLASTAGEAVQRFAFPLSLTIFVLIFLLIQGEIDRRDPKLAFAPVDSSKDMVYFQ
jgi:hypothetical protein